MYIHEHHWLQMLLNDQNVSCWGRANASAGRAITRMMAVLFSTAVSHKPAVSIVYVFIDENETSGLDHACQ
jgi:hypothetical protein